MKRGLEASLFLLGAHNIGSKFINYCSAWVSISIRPRKRAKRMLSKQNEVGRKLSHHGVGERGRGRVERPGLGNRYNQDATNYQKVDN